MVLGLVGGIGLVACALAVWLTTRAAATGTLGLNAFAGIRTPSTMASDAAWRAGHQAALSAATTTAAASAGIGIVLVLAGLLADADESPLLWILFVIGYGSLLVPMVPIVRIANRAARETG